MQEEDKTTNTENGDQAEIQNFDLQISHVREIVEGWGDRPRIYRAPFVDDEGRSAYIKRIALGPRRGGRASIVASDECAVELGAPGKSSINMVLWTTDVSLVNDGEIRLLGPDIQQNEKVSFPYAQIIMLAISADEEVDHFKLESTQYLSNRLQGFMVRTVPGRLWARISHDAVKEGMDFARLGGALIAAYREDFPAVKAVEVLFVTLDDEHVNSLSSIDAEARILAGKNKKLILVGDGEYECPDLDCDDCDEQEVCDDVRDIIILRRKNKGEEK